jgi:ApaG protein
MAKPMPYSAITRGIVVSVQPTYLEAQSSPESSQYFWAYRIVIENKGNETVQLRSRHWRIMNALGVVTEVKGEGVVGVQPVLKPGESYEYSSGAPLNTPSGLMIGTYRMQTDGGEIFNVEIPSFSLDSPHQTKFVH